MLDTSFNFKPLFRDSPLYFTKFNIQPFICRQLQDFYLFYVVTCITTKKRKKKYVHTFLFQHVSHYKPHLVLVCLLNICGSKNEEPGKEGTYFIVSFRTYLRSVLYLRVSGSWSSHQDSVYSFQLLLLMLFLWVTESILL